MAAGCGTPIRGPWAGLETCELPPVGGGRALWPCSGRARKRPEPVRAALCGPGRARAAPTMARQAPVPGGDGLARARAAPAQARPGWPREIKWGCWLGGIRPPQRRYPAAIPGPPIVTKEASIQARAVLMGWRGPRPGAARRRGQGGRGRALQWRAAAEGVGV